MWMIRACNFFAPAAAQGFCIILRNIIFLLLQATMFLISFQFLMMFSSMCHFFHHSKAISLLNNTNLGLWKLHLMTFRDGSRIRIKISMVLCEIEKQWPNSIWWLENISTFTFHDTEWISHIIALNVKPKYKLESQFAI